MVSDLDIWRAAHELLKHRGDDARPYATRRISELTMAGDEAGADTWSRILAALVVLAMDRPGDGVTH